MKRKMKKMNEKQYQILVLVVIEIVLWNIFWCMLRSPKNPEKEEEPKMTVQEEIAQNTLNAKVAAMQPMVKIELTQQNNIVSSNEVEIELEYDELEYLAACVEAEAGTQGMMGKRLVVDVILNRVDDSRFPDNITDVINAQGQFAVVSNGSINKVDITQETFKAIELELKQRTDNEILYFRNGHYGTGKPCYKVNEHYFSK